jgi:ring-1,2-phenylacetyl-CoA epoxidase subunit PaaB
MEGVSIWVVPSSQITASNPDEVQNCLNRQRQGYRHPTFYILPEELKHM